eukprot:gene1948-2277_t
MKVLLMTLQGPPPQLEAQYGARHFSRGMREVVARCLNKDPAQRPSAKQLLEHKFFKQARDADYLKRHILADLPPLPQRVTEIRVGKAATRARENDWSASGQCSSAAPAVGGAGSTFSDTSSPLARPGASLADVYGSHLHCGSSTAASDAADDLTKVRTKGKSEHLTAAQVWDHVREACSEPATQLAHFWRSVAHSPNRRQQQGSSSSSSGPGTAAAPAAQGSSGARQLFKSSSEGSHGRTRASVEP